MYRPHPWGLLVTFIELIKGNEYNFWNHRYVIIYHSLTTINCTGMCRFVHFAPEIERLFESVAQSCTQQRQAHQQSSRDQLESISAP